MAARSEFQALKAYLSRYGESQKQEKRLADRLDRMDKDLARSGAPDPQPGVTPRERFQDFSGTPSPAQGARPRNSGDKNQGAGIKARARTSDIRGDRLEAEGGGFLPDPAPGTGESLRDFRTGIHDPGEELGKTGPDIQNRGYGPGYPAGIQRNEGEARVSSGPLPSESADEGADLNRHPLPPGGDRPGNYWQAERRAQCAKALEEQRAVTASARDGLIKALCFLPSGSERRYVLELRYLDSLSWGVVAEVAHMSRSNCFNKASAGIRELLGHSEVQEMIRGQ